jgi:iron-sulfur cluster repair protein YtfE (RIC family)
MTRSVKQLPTAEAELAAISIRDLIEIEPAMLEVLGPLGIDLCCGGGHPLGEALDLHGIERAEVMPKIVALATVQTR